MNKFTNSAGVQPRNIVVIPKSHNVLQIETNAENEEYYDEFSNDNTTTVEFEVMCDVVTESNHECSTSTNKQHTNKVATNAMPAQWSRSGVYNLIAVYKRLSRDETKGEISFGPTVIWTMVSNKLQGRGFNYTPEQCRTKWSLLKKLYQHIRTESQAQKFEFLTAIHAYYKDPRIESILNTEKQIETPVQKRRGRRKRLCSTLPELLQLSEKQGDDVEHAADEDNATMQVTQDNAHDISQHCSEPDNELEIICKLEIEQDLATKSPTFSEPLADVSAETSDGVCEDLNATVELPLYVQQFKQLIEMQEKRRDERHKKKIQIFCDYNERQLAQQKVAIRLHKQLIERLIDNM